MSVRVLVVLAQLLLLAALPAQRGDRPGERQELLPDSVEVPPALVRSPTEELATLSVPAGFRVELFASEPLIHDPVVGAWDAAGRMWVCEFRSYMKDLEATDESAPDGRVVVLHDDDGDGRADRSTVFADGLVLPRAVLPLRGGALVITPPDLLWMPDSDGDLVADGRERVMGGFEAGTGNPEHSGNGLTWGFDHRIHLCNDRRLLVRTADGFRIEAGAGGGQWGLCLDDRGRTWFNYNSDWLRCDLVPNRYGALAEPVGGLPTLNHRVVDEQSVWPARPTPGINRGYQGHMLRDDYTLARTTAVCSPLVYRARLLPFDGDVFVCEPAGNCVRRFIVSDSDGRVRASNPYEAERREFLASTDERFRPVALMNGPDGALYVIDMYRGVIQHRNYVTSYLRHQVQKRGLEQPIGRGRIWRVVPEGAAAPAPAPRLDCAPTAALVAALRHDSGTVRDLALVQLVAGGRRDAAGALRELLGDERPEVRIAATSALDGLGALTQADARRLFRDQDAAVLSFALPRGAAWLARGDNHLWSVVERMHAQTPANVRWHAALAIGDALRVEGLRSARTDERALARLASFVREAPSDSYLRAAVAAAAHPQLDRVLQQLVGGDAGALRDLAQRAYRSRDADAQRRVLAVAAASDDAAFARALLDGAAAALPKADRRVGWLRFGDVPAALARLAAHGDELVRARAQALLAAVKVGGEAAPGQVANLSEAQVESVRRGERVFRGACAACHQLDGRGQGGLAPPLRDSEWVLGPKSRLIRIALHGVRGPIEVDGTEWSLEMPGQAHLSDRELADVLSYLRRAFGHAAGCVDVDDLAMVRNATKSRAGAWTAAELLEVD